MKLTNITGSDQSESSEIQGVRARLEAMELETERLRNIQSKLILLKPFLEAHIDQDTWIHNRCPSWPALERALLK